MNITLEEVTKLDNKISGIYKILCIPSGNFYIGSSRNIRKRIKAHISNLKMGTHHSIIFQNSWNKHLHSDFIIEILEICEEDELISREQVWIDLLSPKYNVAKFAISGMKGRTQSEEARDKIKLVLSKKFTKEQKIARAKFASSFSVSEESRKKALDSRSAWLLVPENRAKMSESQKAIWKDPSHRQKMSKAHSNYSEEIRYRLSKAQKQLWKENKERYSIARRGRGTAKLTEEDVLEIRKMYKDRRGSFAKIGEIYGVSRGTISSIISRKNWAWVKENE